MSGFKPSSCLLPTRRIIRITALVRVKPFKGTGRQRSIVELEAVGSECTDCRDNHFVFHARIGALWAVAKNTQSSEPGSGPELCIVSISCLVVAR